MLASRLHWRLLVGTILALMAAAWLAPQWVRAPDIQENRVLAAKPAWPTRLRDFAAFRAGADAYVADHFPARPHLIAALNRVRMMAGVSGSNRVIVGRDGWLFFDDDTHLGTARGDPPMPGPEVRQWLMTLAGRTEWLKARGIPYLVVSPPVKETLYPQYAPAWFHGLGPGRPALLLPALAHDSGAGEVLYLRPPVARATAAGEPTYSRHDTHWTGYGAYAGYVGLMTRLHEMGLAEGPRPRSDFQRSDVQVRLGPRDLALMLGVSSFVHLSFPHLVDPHGDPQVTVTYLSPRHDWTAPQVVDTGQVGKPVLLMNRDSFSNELLPFLEPHFSRIVLVHNQDGFWRQDMVDRYKPDIVILEAIEPGLRVALGVGPAPSGEAIARIDSVLSREGLTTATGAPLPLIPRLKLADGKTRAIIAAAKPTNSCNFEVATLAPAAGGDATLTASGWISELSSKITSPLGLLALTGPGGTLAIPIRVDSPRPDVATFFKNPTGRLSGFTGTFFVSKSRPGAYAATVYRRAGGGWISCAAKTPLAMHQAP